MSARRDRLNPDKLRWALRGLFLTALGTGALALGIGWAWLWSYLLSINVTTFVFYAWDKHASVRRGLRRIPEFTLLLLGLVGGSPGALLGRHVLRHKTVKRDFRLLFWAGVVVQIAALAAWYLLGRNG
jgi:uncharacterized membrane protein YsdA (DUF1294 family)